MPVRLARLVLVSLLATLCSVTPAGAQTPGPDYVASDNVELVNRVKTVGTGIGAAIVGKTMFVTSTHSIEAFDITNAESPQKLGGLTLEVQFENEEVPTNGKVLGVSSDYFCVVPSVPPVVGSAADDGCLAIYDVSDPANMKLITVVPGAGDHTSACLLDCTYMYGDGGTITDLRDPPNAKIVGDWVDASGVELQNGCHHVREITNGILLGSCRPLILMSVLPEHGGSPLKPAILATGNNGDNILVHSSRWPRLGRDKFLLVGDEDVLQPQCTDEVAGFSTWDATAVIDPFGGWKRGSEFKMLDQVRPVNGTYADGHSPYNGIGCSVHWFQEHPTFRNGGLVALAEYENGMRFLQIDTDGKITEQGFFLPLGGSTSAPYWHPDGNVVYSIDYERGMDVLKWTGETYVPDDAGNVDPKPGATPGTGGKQPDAPACASAAGFRRTDVARSGTGVRFKTDRRLEQPYTLDVFQVSAGRSLVRERLVTRFSNRTGDFRWNGRGRRRRALRNGFYFARFTMKLPDGRRDVRRVTLRRRGGRFNRSSDFYQRTECGVFRSFKLSGPAFGGRRNAPLGIAYRLAQRAQSVTVEAYVGSRRIASFRGGTARARTYRLALPANRVRRGQLVRIRATVSQGGRRVVQTLTSTRV